MTEHAQGNFAVGYYEPALGVQFLPRCPDCGHKHPLAYQPPLPGGECPGCRRALPEPPEARDVPAVITGWQPSAILARTLLGAGKKLMQIWRARQ